jgi:hypothetical protein
VFTIVTPGTLYRIQEGMGDPQVDQASRSPVFEEM